MKRLLKSLRTLLALIFALGALPLLQGCDDDDDADPNLKNAWMPVGFQFITVGTGSSASGGGSSGG